MLNRLWLCLCPVAVLVVSGCTPEKTEFDYYNPPAPLVVRGTQAQEFRAWDQDSNRGLDFHDAFDMSAAGAVKLSAVTHCRRGGVSFGNEIGVPNPKRVPIFQLVPQELLLVDLHAIPVSCDFKLILSNGTGSRHIFVVATTSVSDNGRADVAISSDSIARYPSWEAGKAAGICNDMTTPELEFRQAIQVSYFDFESPIPREGRTRENILERAAQICRIGIFESGRLVAVSKKFEKVLSRVPVQVRVDMHAPTDVDRGNVATYDYFPFINGSLQKELIRFSIVNPDSIPRRIAIPKARFTGNYEIFSNDSRTQPKPSRYLATRDWLYYSVHESEDVKVKDAGENWIVTLNGPNATVGISVFSAPAHGRCWGTKLFGILISPSQPMAVSEVMEDGRLINSVSLNLQDKVVIGGGRDSSRAHMNTAESIPNSYCEWPL